MNKKLLNVAILSVAIIFSACVKNRIIPQEIVTGPIDPGSRELIHYWNFNNNSSFDALITPSFTIGGAELDYTAAWDEVSEGSELNARNNDVQGSALRLRNPSGDFLIKVPTTGYRDILLSFAVMRTGSGAQENLISYSTDGVNFISTGLKLKSIFSVRYESFNLNDLAEGNAERFSCAVAYQIDGWNSMIKAQYFNILKEESIDPLRWNEQFRIGFQFLFK